MEHASKTLIVALRRMAPQCLYGDESRALAELANALESGDGAAAGGVTTLQERNEARAERDRANERADSAEQRADAAEGQLRDMQTQLDAMRSELDQLKAQKP
jgi:uncharacterized protein HemX